MLDVQLIRTIVGAAAFAAMAACAGGAAAQDKLPAEVVPQIGRAGSAVFSPDSRFVLSAGGYDKTAILWDVTTGKQLRTFTGHKDSVDLVAFSRDGRYVIAGSKSGTSDKTLKLWDIATGRLSRTICTTSNSGGVEALSADGRLVLCGVPPSAGTSAVSELWDVTTGQKLHTILGRAVVFSPDGRLALSTGYRNETEPSGYVTAGLRLGVWDTATGKELYSFTGDAGAVTNAIFSPDGRTMLTNGFAMTGGSTGSAVNMLRLRDVATGRELFQFGRDTPPQERMMFSPGGRTVLANTGKDTAKLWDVATGQELRSFNRSVEAFSPDGRSILSVSAGKLVIWDLETGKELRSFTENGPLPEYGPAEFSPDGRFILNGAKLWDVATGKVLHRLAGHAQMVQSAVFSPDGRLVLSADHARPKLWDAATGKELLTLGGKYDLARFASFLPDNRHALIAFAGPMKLWDVTAGKVERSFGKPISDLNSVPKAVSFSSDGRLVLTASGLGQGQMSLWDVATGNEVRSVSLDTEIKSAALSPDGRFALTGHQNGTMKLWDAAAGKELRTFAGKVEIDIAGEGAIAFSPDSRFALSPGKELLPEADGVQIGIKRFNHEELTEKERAYEQEMSARIHGKRDQVLILWDVATGKEVRRFIGHKDIVAVVAFSPDGRFILSTGWDSTLRLWDAATGKELRSFAGHTGEIQSLAISSDGRFAITGGRNGAICIWDVEKGREIALMMASPEGGEWLAITPEGFFSASQRDTDMLAIVRGLGVTTIGQVHQSLFNPDLVREALAGDPDGEVKGAAEVVSLEKVLDAGPPPAAAITSHEAGSRSTTDLVTVAARLTDRGKGIGRIEWRVNGVTAGVSAVSAGAGPDYEVEQQLALDPGENRIEVIAYEKRNLLASLPARTTIAYDGAADARKPKLHILAIGINAYEDKGWAAPGSDEVRGFPPLGLAVGDATAFAAEMRKAAGELYGEVRVRTALDREATPANLDKIVQEMAAETGPRDTFVLYAAAHGFSMDGNYYMIPQDYQGGIDPEALKTRAIGQARLQDWIANRIKARKAVILLDTCESGALVGGYTKSRADAPASEAAVGRLHEATGRPVLTAAAAGKPAFEGYKGHGVFTYALMEALHKGDTNNNGRIELTELAAHVQKRVPELVAELGEHGGVVKGAAVIAMRGAEGDTQSAHFGSTGEDFSVAARLP